MANLLCSSGQMVVSSSPPRYYLPPPQQDFRKGYQFFPFGHETSGTSPTTSSDNGNFGNTAQHGLGQPMPRQNDLHASAWTASSTVAARDIREMAKKRWLNVRLLVQLLTPELTVLPLSNKTPENPPASGSIFLYDRSKTRYFRNDGHNWVKQRNSSKVREDKVRLKMDGQVRVYACYAHSADPNRRNFHRRTYHLLDVSSSPKGVGGPQCQGTTGTKKIQSRKGVATSGRENHIVLVHYLDTTPSSIGERDSVPSREAERKKLSSEESSDSGRSEDPSAMSSQVTDFSVASAPDSEVRRFDRATVIAESNHVISRQFFLPAACPASPAGCSIDEANHDGVVDREVGCLVPREVLPSILDFCPKKIDSWSTLLPPSIHNERTTNLSIWTSGAINAGNSTSTATVTTYAALVHVVVTNHSCEGASSNKQLRGGGSFPSLEFRDVVLTPLHQRSEEEFECHVPDATTTDGSGSAIYRSHRTIVLVGVDATKGSTTSIGLAGRVRRVLQGACDEALKDVYALGHEPQLSSGNVLRPTFFRVPTTAGEGCGYSLPLSPEIQIFTQLSHDLLEITTSTASMVGSVSGDEGTGQKVAWGPQHVMDFTGSAVDWEDSPPLKSDIPQKKFEENDEKAEMETMSFHDMASALQDVYGCDPPCREKNVDRSEVAATVATVHIGSVKIEGRDGGAGLSGSLLKDTSEMDLCRFDVALRDLPPTTKRTVLIAERECPQLLSHELKALFVAADESGDPKVSSTKFCRYWDMRLELFGRSKAFLPMTLTGAMRDDLFALTEIDFLHYLPEVQDKFGRALFYSHGCRYNNSKDDCESVLRAMWYMLEACSRSRPSEGVVFLVNKSGQSLENVENRLPFGLCKMFNVFPISVRAIHVLNCEWYHLKALPIVRHFMGRDLRIRTIVHSSTGEQLVKDLGMYGIHPSAIPVAVGGELDFDVLQWLKKRMQSGL